MSQNCHCQVTLTVGNRENQYLDVFHQDLIHRALESWSRAPQVARLKKHWQHWRWRLWEKGLGVSVWFFMPILPLANLQLHVLITSGATFFGARRSQDMPDVQRASFWEILMRAPMRAVIRMTLLIGTRASWPWTDGWGTYCGRQISCTHIPSILYTVYRERERDVMHCLKTF